VRAEATKTKTPERSTSLGTEASGASAKLEGGRPSTPRASERVARKAEIRNVEKGRDASPKEALVQIRSFFKSTR